jgi:hypothetical protein
MLSNLAMKDQRREILTQVAAGTITAEEGATRLEALESAPSGAAATAPPPLSPSATAVRQVRVVSRFGQTEIIGDPNVASAVAEGPHRARLDGETMVIEQSPIHDDTSFHFSRPEGRLIINGFDFGRHLTVRVNPSLSLFMTVQAGSVRIKGMNGPINGQVQAGNCIIEDFRAPLNLEVAAGNVAATGRLTEGASSIRCEMGSVRVNLDRSSSVRIKSRSTMGKVALEGEDIKNDAVGSGDGTLDLECTMGNVRVVVG